MAPAFKLLVATEPRSLALGRHHFRQRLDQQEIDGAEHRREPIGQPADSAVEAEK
jgi:hypothetical protein